MGIYEYYLIKYINKCSFDIYGLAKKNYINTKEYKEEVCWKEKELENKSIKSGG
jgi:hypothetical protein